MPNPNCAITQGGTTATCVVGCRETACCEVSAGGENQHHCLSQLNKKLGREQEPADKCGGCGFKLKEDNVRRGTVEDDRGVS